MNSMKRFLALALAFCLSFSVLPPVAAYAEETDAETQTELVTEAEETTVTDSEETEESSESAEEAEETEEEAEETEEETEVEEYKVTDYDTFLANLKILEVYATAFASSNSKYSVNELMINYIRTGVDRYLDGNWKTMAGEEITAFVEYVAAQDAANGTTVSCLRNIVIKNFYLPNGQKADFGHMFGALNIAFISGTASGDLGGWAGDICDLIYYSKMYGEVPEGTVDEMAAYILENCFGVNADKAFGKDDWYADMDAFYINYYAKKGESLVSIFERYFTADLTDEQRAEFFLHNRFSGLLTQEDVRAAIYEAYSSNVGLQVLESDRGISDDDDLRQASCYAFADHLYNLAGDTLTGETDDDENDDGEEEDDTTDDETSGNPYYTEFSSTTTNLAPGVTQTIKYAFTADDKQMAIYIAEVDITRDDLSIHANYKDNDPSNGWGMARVADQIAAAVENHADVENYTPVVGVNGDFYNMSTGKPSGALVMEGVTYQNANGNNFFAILDDGSAVIGTASEWAQYEDRVVEAIGGSVIMVRNGEMSVSTSADYYTSRASRTCVGITADGKVILMVVDGRQEPFSCGASIEELAQIMIDAGCVIAMNLDGGGSTTFVAKAEGSDSVEVVNNPSDGYQRSVSSSLMVVSTAVVSNEFDHVLISTEYDYLTIGSALELEAVGVSASGNAAEIPDGAYWKVSDASVGEISGNTFTALDNGEVSVQMVLADGTVVGEKTLYVVIPDDLYFEEESVNAVYGVPTALPLVATYNGNPVVINEEDFWLIPEDDSAAETDGFNIIGIEESGVRIVNVSAWFFENMDIEPVITVNFYRADEAQFDFSSATGGDAQLAWKREVSNSEILPDGIYQIVDVDGEMVVTYDFALDMTAIEIPEQLSSLVGMLPGGDNENATAWDFLLQLAERVSVLTEVKVVVRFNQNFDVDISELIVSNDFFKLESATLDTDTNTVTIIARWVDQDAAVDPATANPLCILTGIKLTPKSDAAWDANNQLVIVNTGEISYNIFLRANALYSFAQDPANQEKYNLIPFENPDVIIGGTTEKGASFGSTYATFTDSFILDKTNRQGWRSYENFLYYFVDNEPVTGLHRLPGFEDPDNLYFYIFEDDGSCAGTYTGMLDYEGELYYVVSGAAKTGWQTVVNSDRSISYYYFDPETGAAVDGVVTIGGYTYTFEDNILVKGQIVTDANGSRYVWAGDFISQAWVEVDGKLYYAKQNSYFQTGLDHQYSPNGDWTWYCFADDGHVMTEHTGLYDYEGSTYYVEEGIVNEYAGLVKVGDDYYYFNSTGTAVKNCAYWVSKTNDLLPQKQYYFDPEGKLSTDPSVVVPEEPEEPETPDEPEIPEEPEEPTVKDGFVSENGGIYHYEDGELSYAGLIYVDGYYYYVRTSSGQVVTNCNYWITYTNGLMNEGSYNFDAQGRMTNPPVGAPAEPEEPAVKDGFVSENGGIYHYVDGQLSKAGLICVDGYFYYVKTSSGEVVCGRSYWITYTNDLMDAGSYTFDEQGRMVNPPVEAPVEPEQPEEPETPVEPDVKNGFVSENGGIYHYVDGELSRAGLIVVDGYYYYVRTTTGEVVCSRTYWITYTNGLMDEGNYDFDSQGRMITDKVPEVVKNGFVSENGGIYHYVDGQLSKAGLIEVDGELYYVRTTTGEVVCGRSYWITYTNDLLPAGSYTFDAQGRLIQD